jgi:signal transduction histidine kinase/streptogramin lyase
MKTRLLLIVFLPLQLFGQSVDHLHFEQIQGLSQNTVYSIMKDKQGFMWIATADGLNRFDGVDMKTYKPSVENRKGSYNGRIIRSALVEDENERIWFSNGSGLYSYNKKRDLFELHPIKKFNSDSLLALEPICADGYHFWGANGKWGLFDYNLQTNSWENYRDTSDTENNRVFNVTGEKDTNGDFWFLKENGVLFFDHQKKNWKHFFADQKFLAIGRSFDTIYLQSADSLWACDIKTFNWKTIKQKTNSIYTSHPFTKFFTDTKNNVWAGDQDGNIYCKTDKTDIFRWSGNINGENPKGALYPVYSLYVDENDILWVGADVLGLQKAELNRPRFNVYPSFPDRQKENSLFIHSIYEDEEQNVWLGTYRQGLLKLNKVNGVVQKIDLLARDKDRTNDNSVPLIHKDSEGNLWVAQSDNLFVRKKGQNDFTRMTLPPTGTLDEITPFSFYEDKGILYYSTSWGIYQIRKEENKYVITDTRIRLGYIYDIFIDRDKFFWLASENGIYKQKHLGQFGTSVTDTILFKDTGIKSFLEDSINNLLWISTTNGLIVYHVASGQYEIFTESNGLGNSYIYGALKKDSVLWLSTNNGLVKAIIRFTNGSALPDLTFTNFTIADGLPDKEFNSGAFYQGQSGDFYFGTPKGVVWFDPVRLAANSSLPRIVMTNVLVNESGADSTTAAGYIHNLSLPYFRNNLFFSFRGIEINNPDKVSYAYQLENWDEKWVYCGSLNQVRYNKLPPGKYRFKVKAANSAGLWNDNPYIVSIIIHAPFWQTWWFYTLVGIILVVALVLVTRYISQNRLKERIRELEKQQAVEKERSRISKDMHDEIGSGLTRIALMTELMNSQKQLDEKTTEGVKEIAESSRKLIDTMSEIIWTMNLKSDKLSNLLSYLREQTQHYFEPFDIKYVIHFPDIVPDLRLTNEQQRNLFLVSKEALNNALKHSEADTITLSVSISGNKLQFTVTDNGKGINDAEIRLGANGLNNMKQRMEEIHGYINWSSENGNGSTVNYWVEI